MPFSETVLIFIQYVKFAYMICEMIVCIFSKIVEKLGSIEIDLFVYTW